MTEYLDVLRILKKILCAVAFLMISVAQAKNAEFSLDDLEKYFQSLIEINSEFEQIDKNVISNGTF